MKLTRVLLIIIASLLSTPLTYAANYGPRVGTITPSSGSSNTNQAVNFTTTYTDQDGWQNIQYVALLINTSTSKTKCFYGYYNQNTNKLYLRNDANSSWLGGYAPGSSNIIQNSYAILDCSKTLVTGSGTTMSVTWNVAFKYTFIGSKKTYLYVKDDAGSSNGWTQKGTWTINNQSPQVGTITPSSGTSDPNQPVTFTTTYIDSDDWRHIQSGVLLINTSINLTNCFYGAYDQNTNKLYLRKNDNSGWLGGYAPGSSKIIQNSYATLDCSKTLVTGSGATMSIAWNIIFKPTFLGSKNMYLYVKDDAGASNGFTQKGTWSIQTDTTPPTGNIKINNDNEFTNLVSVTLALSAQDNTGGSGLDKMQFSNDNIVWSGPEPYATTKSWRLSAGDGEKTVYAKFSDIAGNWSATYFDTIVLDTTPPQVTITDPQDGAVITD